MQRILIPEFFRLTQPVNLNNQAIGIGYRLQLLKRLTYFFPHVLFWTRVSRNTKAHRQS